MRHRDDDARAAARACPLQEPGEHLRYCSERACGEVGDLDRRQLGSRVLEDARPAEVVDVVARAQPVARIVAEAGDRAVDHRFRDVAGADAESLGHSRPEAFEHDVGARGERARERRIVAAARTRPIRVPDRSAVSQAVAVDRIGSPPGGSTRTTRAPRRASSRLAYAPGRYRVKSTTSVSDNGCTGAERTSILVLVD